MPEMMKTPTEQALPYPIPPTLMDPTLVQATQKSAPPQPTLIPQGQTTQLTPEPLLPTKIPQIPGFSANIILLSNQGVNTISNLMGLIAILQELEITQASPGGG